LLRADRRVRGFLCVPGALAFGPATPARPWVKWTAPLKLLDCGGGSSRDVCLGRRGIMSSEREARQRRFRK
jgi:hypothetical protein